MNRLEMIESLKICEGKIRETRQELERLERQDRMENVKCPKCASRNYYPSKNAADQLIWICHSCGEEWLI